MGGFWHDDEQAVQSDGNVVDTDEEGEYELHVTDVGPLCWEDVSIRFRGLDPTLVEGGIRTVHPEVGLRRDGRQDRRGRLAPDRHR